MNDYSKAIELVPKDAVACRTRGDAHQAMGSDYARDARIVLPSRL